jgi:hypothetical protein
VTTNLAGRLSEGNRRCPRMDINFGNTVPIFAHDVLISTVTKAKKGDDGKVKKEIFNELVFIDSVKQSAITRIILPASTLEGLPKMIEETIKKNKKEMKLKEMPKEKEKESKKENSYLG